MGECNLTDRICDTGLTAVRITVYHIVQTLVLTDNKHCLNC